MSNTMTNPMSNPMSNSMTNNMSSIPNNNMNMYNYMRNNGM
jgi:hypothetical protein